MFLVGSPPCQATGANFRFPDNPCEPAALASLHHRSALPTAAGCLEKDARRKRERMGSCSSCCRTGVRFDDEPQLLSTSNTNDNDSGNVEHSVEDSDGLDDSGDETEMEEEVNTQQATQIHVDPRRLGRNNSGIYDKDLADLICILHPTSPLAHRVVEDLAKTNPQHIFRNEELLAPIDNDDPEISPSNPQGAPRRPSTTSHDIALRLSSTVKDITMGFVFGRNILRSDILLNVSDDAKRLSNTHFRIYLNESGVVMLQDCSTNGTRVDDIMLRYKPVANEPVNGASRMLITGSCIELMTGTQDNIKFMVRIPKERHPYEDDYAEKVDERSRAISEEVARREEARRKNNAARGLAGQVFPGAVSRHWHSFDPYWNPDSQHNIGSSSCWWNLTPEHWWPTKCGTSASSSSYCKKHASSGGKGLERRR